jgi:uncharacterized membrane protein SirB2
MKNTIFNSKNYYILASIMITIVSIPVVSLAKPVGCEAAQGIWAMVFDSVKSMVLPLGGLAILGLGAQMLMDQENAHFKTKAIKYIIYIALGIVLIYTAPEIIKQIATSTGNTLVECK